MMKKTKTAAVSITAPKKSTTAQKKKRVNFKLEGVIGSKVYLAGSFNDWSETAKKMTDKKANGIFTCQCLLPLGTHQYKFIVDGIWTLDNSNPNFTNNDLGTLNSVIDVA